MKRRRVVRRDDGITLFPFLAVLICTMGSLIVLLVVVVQQAKANAANASRHQAEARRQRQEEIKRAQQNKEEFEWRIDVLEGSREELMEQLDNRRMELSHLENELRQLTSQLDAAIAEAEQIAELENTTAADQAASEQRVHQLREALRAAEAELEEARESVAGRQRTYSIVPYEGPHGTQRRPLFVECLADRVVIQPEGIELTERDFIQPLTDDNPLAAALRAKREYLSNAFRSSDGHPYPLLIVRPEGAKSYAAARAAMRSWDAEFGYELVGGDLQLNYPAKDPALAERVRHAVQVARERRRRLQAIAPARFGRRSSTTLKASRNGGFVRESATAEPGHHTHGWASNGLDRDLSNSKQAHGDTADATPMFSQTGKSEFALGESSHQPNDPAATNRSGDRRPPGENGPTTGVGGRDQATYREQAPAQTQTAGRSPRPSETPSSPPPQHAQRASSNPASSLSSSTAATGGSPIGSHNPRAVNLGARLGSGSQSPPATESLAHTRGHDWGLPHGGAAATGITRPIGLVVTPNRIELLPEGSSARGRVQLALEGSMKDELDELVTILWKRMEDWGIAGANMYWKPVLSVRVNPGAESRFQELQILLKNSGIGVERKF